MRQIGTIENPEQAERFAAYMTTLGTTCTVDTGSAGRTIWVHEEDRVLAAKEELHRFQNEPDHERYRNARQQVATVIRQRQQTADNVRKRTIDVRERWKQPDISNGPATMGLMFLMLVVAYQTGLDPRQHPQLAEKLYFSLPHISHGEVWRLVTPIFLHFSILHLLFNLMWMRDLGLIVEFRLGTPKFLAMILTIAVLSNFAEYLMTGPGFGGMSGVIYGLFGYVWVRSKLDPASGFWISKSSVTMMLGWFVICILLPINVANWAHGGGLVMGAAMGASGTVWKSLTGRR